MEKLLFMHEAKDGVDLYLYFESVLLPQFSKKKVEVPPYAPGTTYYLELPYPVVSPRLYQTNSRLAKALGIRDSVFAEICRGERVIVTGNRDEVLKTLDERDRRSLVTYGDALILHHLLIEGYRGVSALDYFLKHHLPDITLRRDATVSAVRVDYETVKALIKGQDAFLEDPVFSAYADVFSHIARVSVLYMKNAPRIIQNYEQVQLSRALEKLIKVAPYPIDYTE